MARLGSGSQQESDAALKLLLWLARRSLGFLDHSPRPLGRIEREHKMNKERFELEQLLAPFEPPKPVKPDTVSRDVFDWAVRDAREQGQVEGRQQVLDRLRPGCVIPMNAVDSKAWTG